uniref:Uncharacterized protein n=1 Tax=Avena sativa TaxID=4498 RepID=A0ACD5VXT7_AVESA
MTNSEVCNITSSNHISGKKPVYKKERSNVKLEDLPLDVLCTIVSKLPAKEVSRASVLSTNWRYICGICFYKLCFTGADGCCRDSFERDQYCQYMQRFIDHVYVVVQKCHAKLIEEFNVKFEFDTMLLDHLNNWVNFAVSSQTKSIAIYLCPINKRRTDVDRYVFPFHLLNSESKISHLQCIQLSFVSFRPPSEFRGFPSLRKLDLEFVDITMKDLDVISSNCCNLTWLSLVRCFLNCELKLDHLLSRLLHLKVVRCRVTRIELRVMKLATFVYDGCFVPIVLNQDSKLDNAHITFSGANFQDAVTALLNGIPSMQHLTLQITWQRLETQFPLNKIGKFTHLKVLQLLMGVTLEDINKFPFSILRAAPFIEKLEIHFSGGDNSWFMKKYSGRKHLEQCEYNYLKSMYMTGYKGAIGQLEFLLHIVGNAPALEVLTVEMTQRLYGDIFFDMYKKINLAEQQHALSTVLCKSMLSSKVKLCVM